MTITVESKARAIQLGGVLGTVIGMGLIVLAPFCASGLSVLGGGLAAMLNVAGLATRRRNLALALSIAPVPILLLVSIVSIAASCRPVSPFPPAIPVGFGPGLIFAGVFASILGSLARRLAR